MQERPARQAAQQEDPLLSLIQQAEQLKVALEQANTGRGLDPLLAAASLPAKAAGSCLPNLLLPAPTRSTPAGISPSSAAALTDGSLSAATAALLAAAKALRQEGERLPMPTRAAPAAVITPAPSLPAALQPAFAGAPAAELDCSDPESDAEDALLECLFFSQQQQGQQGQHLHVSTGCGGASPSEAAATGSCPEQPAAVDAAELGQQLALRVQLQGLELAAGSGPRQVGGSSVRCVVKPLQSGGQAQQLTLPVGALAAACLVELLLPHPAGAGQLHAEPLPSLPPYLFLEFWQHSGMLLGMCKVPLLQPSCCLASAAGQGKQQRPAAVLPAVVAEGRQPINNILELEPGHDAGSIHVAAVLQVGCPRIIREEPWDHSAGYQ